MSLMDDYASAPGMRAKVAVLMTAPLGEILKWESELRERLKRDGLQAGLPWLRAEIALLNAPRDWDGCFKADPLAKAHAERIGFRIAARMER